MALACSHQFHSRCWQSYFVANSGWCTCPNCRAPSNVTDHWVHMCPEEFGISTPREEEEGPRDPQTDHLEEEMVSDGLSAESIDEEMLAWWPSDESVYHSNTRLLDGRAGVLIDTGAWANLSGDRWANLAADLSNAAGYRASRQRMSKPMSVQGVGNGSQQCEWQTTIPAAVRLEDGPFQKFTYTSPYVPDSDLPALLGLKTLMNHGAIIDCRNKKMFFCGPGDAKIELPPGSMAISLEQAPSGHLILPISEYDQYKAHLARQSPTQPQQPTMTLPVSTPTASTSTSSSSSAPIPTAEIATAVAAAIREELAAATARPQQLRGSAETGQSVGTRCPRPQARREEAPDHRIRAAAVEPAAASRDSD